METAKWAHIFTGPNVRAWIVEYTVYCEKTWEEGGR